jgi:putative transposase
MRNSRFSEEQIAYALRQVESGVPATEVCRKMGVSEQTFYLWKRRFGGMGPPRCGEFASSGTKFDA